MNFIYLYKEIPVLYDMKTEMCVLPIQCKICRGVFDLWYDLQQQGINGEDLLQSPQSAGGMRMENLCWRCRIIAAEQAKMQQYQEYESFENMNEDNNFGVEFEFEDDY